MITLTIDKRQITVEDGTSVAAALLASGETAFRTSVTGEPRGPVCGMGVCFECRVTINSIKHQRSCIIIAREEMEVVTGE